MRVPSLETERLVVREFTLEDLQPFSRFVAELYRDPSDTDDERFLREQRQFLQWMVLCYEGFARLHQPPYAERAIVIKSTGKLIGSIGYVPAFGPFRQLPTFDTGGEDRGMELFEPAFGLYWAIAARHRQHGYATEAARALIDYGFRELRLRRIVATTDYDNHASMGVMRKLGMRLDRNPRPDPPWFQVVGILDNNVMTDT